MQFTKLPYKKNLHFKNTVRHLFLVFFVTLNDSELLVQFT